MDIGKIKAENIPEKFKTIELLENELNPERLRMWVLQSTKNLIELFLCPLYLTHQCACALLLDEGQIWLIKNFTLLLAVIMNKRLEIIRK